MAVPEGQIQLAGMPIGGHIVPGRGVAFAVGVIIDGFVGTLIADHPVVAVAKCDFGGRVSDSGTFESPECTRTVIGIARDPLPVQSISAIQQPAEIGVESGEPKCGFGADVVLRPSAVFRGVRQPGIRAQLREPVLKLQISQRVECRTPAFIIILVELRQSAETAQHVGA